MSEWISGLTYFRDGSPYTYLKEEESKNVGWLDKDNAFPRGNLSERALNRLMDISIVSVNQTRGLHCCEFCGDNMAQPTFIHLGKEFLLGSAEIRVFDPTGISFAAPNLLVHYVLQHKYLPPSEFIFALEHGPNADSKEYPALLKSLGLSPSETLTVT